MGQHSVVHAFPGQGEFSAPALTQAVRRHALVRKTLTEVFACVDEVGTRYGIPPLGPELLKSTGDLSADAPGAYQLAFFGTQMTLHRALVEIGMPPDRVLGISFGEIAALTAAGILTLDGGARAAIRAARSLLHYPGGMTLLLTTLSHGEEIIREATSGDVTIACVNHPNEIVVTSSLSQELDCLEQYAADHDVHAIRLPIPFRCHHPTMAIEADDLADSLRQIPTTTARLPVYSAVHARPYAAGDDVHRRATDSLVLPFCLPQALRAAAPDGPTVWMELGTGKSFARAARHTLGALHTVVSPLADPDFSWENPGGNP